MQVTGWMDGWREEWVNRRMIGKMNGWMHGWINVWLMKGWMDGCKKCMDNEWIDGWMKKGPMLDRVLVFRQRTPWLWIAQSRSGPVYDEFGKHAFPRQSPHRPKSVCQGPWSIFPQWGREQPMYCSYSFALSKSHLTVSTFPVLTT